MKGDFSRITFKKEKHYSKVNMQQGRVQVDADWNEQIDILNYFGRNSFRDVIGQSGAPVGKPGYGIKPTRFPEGPSYTIGEGSFYVDGILVENQHSVEASRQPNLPLNKDCTSMALPYKSGLYLVYLDAWERHITELDDPEIRESALNGTDTATRSKIIWQVKLYPLYSESACVSARHGGDPNILCQTSTPDWKSYIASPTGTLEARATPGEPKSDPYMISSGTGYKGLENQLYRIEIHSSGKANKGATFKWQRNNGTIVFKAMNITEKIITITDTGTNKLLGFNNEQWVEVVDDRHELLNLPGTLVKILVISETELAVIGGTVKGDPLTNDSFPQIFNPKIRKWDSAGGDIPITTPSSNDGYIEIEAGIEVRFRSKYYEGDYKDEEKKDEGRPEFRTGDYWNIPARTLKGDIEWPRNLLNSPIPKLPDGISHHYSPLAILEFVDRKIKLKADCRRIFRPLIDLEPMRLIPQPQTPKIASTWTHGNAVCEGVHNRGLRKYKKGEGAEFTAGAQPTTAWFHFPLSTSFAFEKIRPLLTKVYVVFQELNENTNLEEIVIFDGPSSVSFPLALTSTLDPSIVSISQHSSGNSILGWNIAPPIKMEFGLGVSVKVNFKCNGRVSFSSVGADFKFLE